MVTVDEGGGGGFCTFAVLPSHPASTEITAANGSKRIHRRVATATLLKLHATVLAGIIYRLAFPATA